MYYQRENFDGTYDFRCRFHNSFTVEAHIHKYSEILYCQKGNCEISINGKKVHLEANEFVFIPPNYIHQYNLSDVNVICAVFSNDFIPLFFKFTKGRKLSITKFKADELKSIFELLPQTDKSKTVILTAYLNLICNKVIEQGDFEKSTLTDDTLYQKVISYVSKNFIYDISLKQIASRFGYNQKYLSSALHSLTGMHFSDFIAVYRVEYARELLTKSSELSITEISKNCGFTAINTFNRQFKKITSMTPTEYKRIYSITKKP